MYQTRYNLFIIQDSNRQFSFDGLNQIDKFLDHDHKRFKMSPRICEGSFECLRVLNGLTAGLKIT